MLTFKENIAIDEKVKRILEKAGWYPGRRENIDEVINYFKKYGIALSEKAKDFISEYYKIMPYWFFNTDKTDRGGDFEFMFFPYPSSYKINVFDYLYDDLDGALKSEEYKAVEKYDENICMVGEIGHYYPARVWIGNSGKLICTHDYEDEVLIFENVFELIEYEIAALDITSVSYRGV